MNIELKLGNAEVDRILERWGRAFMNSDASDRVSVVQISYGGATIHIEKQDAVLDESGKIGIVI